MVSVAAVPFTCFHCKKEVEITPVSGVSRVGMRDTCPHCHTDLHVCFNCAFYDPGSHHECREPQAEFVLKKDRGNRCDYFRSVDRAAGLIDQSKAKAISTLDDLFKK